MTVFFVIGLVGLGLLLVSLIAGEVVEGLVDGIGGEWVSGAGLAGFLGAFGFAGALALQVSDSTGVGVVVGLLAGVAMGFLVALATRYLRSGGRDSTVRTASLVGRSGSVATPVPADGFGEVTLVAAGHLTRLNARSATPLAAGTDVTITEVLSATSVMVEPSSLVPPAVSSDVALDRSPAEPSSADPTSVQPGAVDPDPAAASTVEGSVAGTGSGPGPDFTAPAPDPGAWSPWASDQPPPEGRR